MEWNGMEHGMEGDWTLDKEWKICRGLELKEGNEGRILIGGRT